MLQNDLAQFKSEKNVAAVQFDIVGHSMGGLVTRAFALQKSYLSDANYHEGIVHKLITIDTPHEGSAFAQRLEESNLICRSLWPYKVGQAVMDLIPGSSLLTKLTSSGKQLLMAHAIVGAASPDQASVALSNWNLADSLACPNLLPADGFVGVFNGEASDLIVSVSSQSSTAVGFSLDSITTTSSVIHALDTTLFTLGPDALNRLLQGNTFRRADGSNPQEVIRLLNTPLSKLNANNDTFTPILP